MTENPYGAWREYDAEDTCASGQAIGGMVQGLGGAFLEHLVYDANGQLLTGNLADYLIPTATDFPKNRAIALENLSSICMPRPRRACRPQI